MQINDNSTVLFIGSVGNTRRIHEAAASLGRQLSRCKWVSLPRCPLELPHLWLPKLLRATGRGGETGGINRCHTALRVGEFVVATGGEVEVAIGDEQNQREKRRIYAAGATEKTQQIVRGLDHEMNYGCTARTPNAMRWGRWHGQTANHSLPPPVCVVARSKCA